MICLILHRCYYIYNIPFIYPSYPNFLVQFALPGGARLPSAGGRRLCPAAQARAAERSQAHVGVLLKLGGKVVLNGV